MLKLGLHFQNRFRRKIDRKKYVNSKVKLSNREIDDIKIWLDFYRKARTGVSFNLIVFRQPSKMYLSDSCPHRVGSFSLKSGRAWRLKLPLDLVWKVSNDLLEFMADIICIWVDILENEMDTFDCYLSLGDNTSAIGWMHKSNLCDVTQLPHEEAAQHLARSCVDNDIYIYAQHFKGVWNVVSDFLSRDHHIPAEILTILLRLIVLTQMPQNFRMSPLSQEIESWVYRTLQLSTKLA